MVGVAMEKRRINKTDRRQRAEKLPLKDNDGNTIALDRRYFPDRRKSHFYPERGDNVLAE